MRREVAWKKISGEVFRKPRWSFIFCVLVGGGVQCLLVLYSVMICTIVDVFSPFDKGIYIGLTITIFPFFGLFNGILSARMYTFFNGSNWYGLGTAVCFFLPAVIGGSILLIDFLETFDSDVRKILPAYEALTMFIFWLMVHVPFSIFGTMVGFYFSKIQAPTRVNRVPRDPPKSSTLPLYMKDGTLCLLVGAVPVAVIIFEIQLILDNINGAENIHMISWFMYFAFALFLVVAVQLAVSVNYMLLCFEEYRWWWKVWAYGSSTGVFIFLVLLNYLLWDLQVDTYTTLVTYWVFSGLLCTLVGLTTGSACVLAAFRFNMFLYSNIKND